MTNIINPGAFLRTSRDFPEDPQALRMELNKAYIDTSNAVNSRTTGIYPVNASAISGEFWFISGNRQTGLRQVYPFTAAGNIPHGITLTQIFAITRIYGTFVDESNPDPTTWIWYPLPYVDVTNANNQINVKVTATNIVITAGGGTPPTITQGYVVLEWISNI